MENTNLNYLIHIFHVTEQRGTVFADNVIRIKFLLEICKHTKLLKSFQCWFFQVKNGFTFIPPPPLLLV